MTKRCDGHAYLQESEAWATQVQCWRSVLYSVVELLASFVPRHAHRMRNRLLRDGLVPKVYCPQQAGLAADLNC